MGYRMNLISTILKVDAQHCRLFEAYLFKYRIKRIYRLYGLLISSFVYS